MNKKIFGAIAATIAAFGSAIIAVPAQAVEQTVDVSVNVEPFIYLRTFKEVKLKVTQGDLGGVTGDQTPLLTDGTTLIDKTVPTTGFSTGGLKSVTKPINELYAVWGNTTSNVVVKVTPITGKDMLTGPSNTKAKIVVGTPIGINSQVPTTTTPFVGGVNLDISFQDTFGAAVTPSAGDYTGGQLKVDASQI
jgi:hypothetical protein